jgi:hypothetical protein
MATSLCTITSILGVILFGDCTGDCGSLTGDNILLIGRALCRAMEHCCSCWVNVKQSLLFVCCALKLSNCKEKEISATINIITNPNADFSDEPVWQINPVHFQSMKHDLEKLKLQQKSNAEQPNIIMFIATLLVILGFVTIPFLLRLISGDLISNAL